MGCMNRWPTSVHVELPVVVVKSHERGLVVSALRCSNISRLTLVPDGDVAAYLVDVKIQAHQVIVGGRGFAIDKFWCVTPFA